MDSIINLLIENAVKPVCSFAKNHISYVVCESRLVKDLAVELNNLEAKKTEIDMRVRGSSRKRKDIVPQVDKWLQEVRTLIEEVNRFLDQEQTNSDNKWGFSQFFCSICNHYKMGKETANMLNTLKEKLKEAREPCFFEVGISPPPSPPAHMALPPTAYSKGYDSRESLLEEIIEALKVKNMIGIYGMAGVGKTVLVERLAAEVKSRNLFDEVGIATVSRTPDPAAIRAVIADRILHVGLHAYNSEEGKKDKLHTELESLMHQQKKVLLILDDAWELLVLHDVGIPKPDKGIKIVVTSRFQHVCAQMGDKEPFEVHVLNKQEAWSLFLQELGDFSEILDTDEGYKVIAVEMVEHFGGLPLALVTLARALIAEELSAWRDIASYLRERSLDKIDGMSDKVMGAINLSFNYLRHREAQVIFLLCCLFPEDWNIEVDVLLKYGIGLGLFGNVTLVQAMNRVERLTKMLRSRSLLLEGNEVRTVKLHDVTRHTGLHIASKGEFDILVKDYRGCRTDVLSDDMLIGKHAISISSKTSITKIFPQDHVMKYHNLQILCLHESKVGYEYEVDFLSHKLSTFFFEGMGNLKVLDIRNMEISSFTTSLGSLKKNLRTLCLHHCRVGDFTEVGELTNLEVLDLRDSRIHSGFCGSLRRLIGLRVLDLTSYHVNEMFGNLVGGLPWLEGLYMLNLTNMDYNKPNISSLVELEMLTHLEVLELQVGIPHQLTNNFLSVLSNLSSFRICVSEKGLPLFYKSLNNGLANKILSFDNVIASKHLQQCLGQLLRVSDAVYLNFCIGLPMIFRYGGDVSKLRYMRLCSCDDVEIVISEPSTKTEFRQDQLTSFTKLEELILLKMPVLKAICAPSQHVYLSQLKRLFIMQCEMLSYAFTISVARHLGRLKNLEITYCGEMEEIFAIDNNTSGNSSSFEGTNHGVMDDSNSIVLPSLQLLILIDLAKLRLFSAKNRSHGPQPAFFGQHVQLPELKELFMRHLPSCEKIWESHHTKGSFGQLTSLEISDCKRLRYAFPAAVASGLVQLNRLDIWRCDKVKEVVVIERRNDVEEEEESKIKFPRLKYISLRDLPRLRSFCSARWSAMEFPSLEVVEMSGNDSMQRFSYGPLYTPQLRGQDYLNTVVGLKYEETKVRVHVIR